MFRSTNSIDKLLDKATSHLLLEPDWPTIIQICDLIRQGDCQPKQALNAINKKLSNDNPHVSMFALLVLESVVKNCGSPVHEEIGSRSYMEQLRDLLKSSPHDNVRNKILELLQAWAFAFRNSPKYRAVPDVVNILKAEGYKFPPQKESDAMFLADTAPEWADGLVCHRCRTQFTMMIRKHHCRACGQVFCGQCSSKTSTIPKFGIEKEVRVCEACYDQINNFSGLSRPAPAASVKVESDLPPEYVNSSLAQQSQTAPRRTEDELREEEELQLALALSQSEAEEKEKKKSKPQHMALSSHLSSVKSEPPPQVDENPELARYLDRSYWDQRHKEDSNKVPSAPSHFANVTAPVSSQVSSSTNNVTTTLSSSNGNVIESVINSEQNGIAEDNEIDDFLKTLRGQVEIFVNRMKSNSSRGRSIVNDSSVQALFMNITAMHSQLLRFIQQQDDKRVYYEGLQDKLTQVKDARAALDALRFEHREKLRQQAEEAERLRQMQMAQKLDIMRQKKQEYLQYQRQLALQRIQEQEREMQMRQEQQKQQYLMGGPPYNRFMPPSGMPPGSIPHGALPPYAGAMYSQAGNPAFLSHQPPFQGHIHPSMIPPIMLGQPGHGNPPNSQGGSIPPGGPQPNQVGPVGHQPNQLRPVGPQQAQMIPPGQMVPPGSLPSQMGPLQGQMGPGGPQPGQMGPAGPQPGQMGPAGPQPGQMGPGGPQPGQMGPAGPQPTQMGPGGPQPGQMGPGGPQAGQMGPGSSHPSQMRPGGPQHSHMGANMPQQGQMVSSGPQGPGPHSAAMVMNGQGTPIGLPGSMVHMAGLGPMGMQQAPVGTGMMGGQEHAKNENDELISFD